MNYEVRTGPDCPLLVRPQFLCDFQLLLGFAVLGVVAFDLGRKNNAYASRVQHLCAAQVGDGVAGFRDGGCSCGCSWRRGHWASVSPSANAWGLLWRCARC